MKVYERKGEFLEEHSNFIYETETYLVKKSRIFELVKTKYFGLDFKIKNLQEVVRKELAENLYYVKYTNLVAAPEKYLIDNNYHVYEQYKRRKKVKNTK